MARKEIKQEVERYADIFRPFYDKALQVQITNSNVKPFNSMLKGVRVATLAMLKGIEPDKRLRDGKDYTPPSFLVEFEDGQLFFILEDIRNVRLTLSGVVLSFDNYDVLFVSV